MKKFRVKYERKNDDGFTRYCSELIEAKGIMHAHKLATDHAKVIKNLINSIHEVVENESG